MPKKIDSEVQIDRRSTSERRGEDRRKGNESIAEERRTGGRRKVQRRRQIDPTTCERDYTNDEIEFMQALDDYKRASGRMFPTCSEILEVIRALGYVKQDDPAEFTEPTDDGSNLDEPPAAELAEEEAID